MKSPSRVTTLSTKKVSGLGIVVVPQPSKLVIVGSIPTARSKGEKTMQVKLTQLKSNHNNVRTKEIVGEAAMMPTVGSQFSVTGAPLKLDQGSRYLITTPVTDIIFIDEKTYEFTTMNSTYKLEIL